MKHLLLISYYFPPDGGAGTQRAAKLVKWLPSCGWDTTVITRTPAATRGPWDPIDEGLLADVGSARAVVRVPGPEMRRRWIERITDAARTIMRTQSVDAALVTMSPFWLSGLGPPLRKLGLPVVLDLRDPWAFDGWREYRSRWHLSRDRRRMNAALAAADLVIANTPEAGRVFGDRVPSLRRPPVVVTNGFDPDDAAAIAPGRRPDGVFRLVHTGTFHCRTLEPDRRLHARLRVRPRPIDGTGRTPFYLLQAIARLRATGDPLGARIRFIHAGLVDDALRRCVDASGVADAVELRGYRPHAESVALLQSADALFLPLHDLPAGEAARIVPGKLYEYLGVARPILACLPAGDARTWIESSGAGLVTRPTDSDAIATALRRLAAHPVTPDPAWATRFTRHAIARRLAAHLDELITPAAPPQPAASGEVVKC
ncbi:MAG: glycosyltransferase [Phycisphaerales bacterium]|nr:glycosyltransferase [Phycisphaerales bacterium]